MNTFYLNNDKLKAVVGSMSGKKIKVAKFCSADFPNEFLDEPTQDKIDTLLTEAMLSLIRNEEIKSGPMAFVADNPKIPFREMIMPNTAPSKLLPIIKQELFTDKKMISTNAVDYVEIEKDINDEHQNRLMVSYMDVGIIDNLKKVSKDIGFPLKSLNIVQNCISKLMWYMRDELPENFVLVDYHTLYTTIYLFCETKHMFSMTKAIFSTPNENFTNEMAYFVNDISSQISEAVSFFNTKYYTFAFDTIFVTGYTEKLESCIASIASYLKMNVQFLPKPWGVTGMGEHEFNEYSSLIGSLVVR